MQTLSADSRPAVEVGRPAYRPFRVRVRRVERLTPSFYQVTFAAPDLSEFGDGGLDQRIKLLLPDGAGRLDGLDEFDDGESWYQRWLGLSDDIRPAMRTYTVRRPRPRDGEIDVVLVDHETPFGTMGPAVRWLRGAVPGDEIVLVGPDIRSPDRHQGIDWRPGAATRLLLAGDETAAPAIVAVLESVAGRPDVTARAFVEVPDDRDRLPATLAPNIRVHWLARGHAPHGSLLGPAVTSWLDGHARLLDEVRATGEQVLDDIDVDEELLWDTPDPSDEAFYAWIAGEAAAVKALRRARGHRPRSGPAAGRVHGLLAPGQGRAGLTVRLRRAAAALRVAPAGASTVVVDPGGGRPATLNLSALVAQLDRAEDF